MTWVEVEEGKAMPRAGEKEQRLFKVERREKEKAEMPLWSHFHVCSCAALTVASGNLSDKCRFEHKGLINSYPFHFTDINKSHSVRSLINAGIQNLKSSNKRSGFCMPRTFHQRSISALIRLTIRRISICPSKGVRHYSVSIFTRPYGAPKHVFTTWMQA